MFCAFRNETALAITTPCSAHDNNHFPLFLQAVAALRVSSAERARIWSLLQPVDDALCEQVGRPLNSVKSSSPGIVVDCQNAYCNNRSCCTYRAIQLSWSACRMIFYFEIRGIGGDWLKLF